MLFNFGGYFVVTAFAKLSRDMSGTEGQWRNWQSMWGHCKSIWQV